jgi:hypothetical protein
MLVGIALGLTIDMFVPRAHAASADTGAIVRVLTRIAVALEAGNRARSDR